MNSKVKFYLILGAIAIAIILFHMAIFASVNNRVVSYEEQIYESQSSLQTQEKRRVDLLYNMVDAIESYNNYEQSTLIQIVEARKNVAAGNIENAETLITAMVEAYPELKSSENYRQYMLELANTENLIQNYRENYNNQVKAYNNYTRSFPAKIFLNLMGYERVDFEYLTFNVSPDAPTNLFHNT